MRKPFSRGRKSFLERNQLVIGSIGVLVVIVVSVLALALSGGVFADTVPLALVSRMPLQSGAVPGDFTLSSHTLPAPQTTSRKWPLPRSRLQHTAAAPPRRGDRGCGF